MKTFYTSDTHFNQERTYTYSMRGMYFSGLKEATEEMVKRWNDVVGKDDTVYHLGDFGDYSVAKRLNGNIILLYGNYERDGNFPIEPYQEKYFHAIYNKSGLLGDYLMVHEPKNRKKAVNDILTTNQKDVSELFYLFGHIHEKQKVKRNGLNVGVDVHNFTPVSREVVDFYKGAIQNIYGDDCFDTY